MELSTNEQLIGLNNCNEYEEDSTTSMILDSYDQNDHMNHNNNNNTDKNDHDDSLHCNTDACNCSEEDHSEVLTTDDSVTTNTDRQLALALKLSSTEDDINRRMLELHRQMRALDKVRQYRGWEELDSSALEEEEEDPDTEVKEVSNNIYKKWNKALKNKYLGKEKEWEKKLAHIQEAEMEAHRLKAWTDAAREDMVNEAGLLRKRKAMGLIDIDEIKESCGVDTFMAEAIIRCLDVDTDGMITREELDNFVKLAVWEKGEDAIDEKIRVFLRFLDISKTQRVTLQELRLFSDQDESSVSELLGFTRSGVPVENYVLTEEALYKVFSGSKNGIEVLDQFIDRILHLLQGATNKYLNKDKSATNPNPDTNTNTLCGVGVSSWVVRAYEGCLHVVLYGYPLLCTLQLVLFMAYYLVYHQAGASVSICIAKGFGLNLRVLTVLIFLTMARTTMDVLKKCTIIKPVVPTGHSIGVHSFIGFSILLNSVGHTLAHLSNQANNTDGFKKAFAVGKAHLSLLAGASWKRKAEGDAITGYLLLLIILLVSLTALCRGQSSRHYAYFYFTHFLYLFWLPLLFLHVPSLWPWFLVVACILGLERWYDLNFRTEHATLAYSRVFRKNIVYLDIPINTMDTPIPGSYYRLKVPAISDVEWHPFSLAGNASADHLNFFIAVVGDWTGKLKAIVSDPTQREDAAILVQGPFETHTMRSLLPQEVKPNLVVASGIGITPFFSIIATKIAHRQGLEAFCHIRKRLFNENHQRKIKTSMKKSSTSRKYKNKVLGFEGFSKLGLGLGSGSGSGSPKAWERD